MFTQKEATKQRVGAYAAALERELDGYKRRLEALADGKFERLDKEQLQARIGAVKAELARVGKLKPEPNEPEPETEADAKESGEKPAARNRKQAVEA